MATAGAWLAHVLLWKAAASKDDPGRRAGSILTAGVAAGGDKVAVRHRVAIGGVFFVFIVEQGGGGGAADACQRGREALGVAYRRSGGLGKLLSEPGQANRGRRMAIACGTG